MNDVPNFTREDTAAVRRLFEAVAEATLVGGATLKALYGDLCLGSGFFTRRQMAQDIEARTFAEVWAYISALLVCMVESWPRCSSDVRAVVFLLETSLFEVQRENYRPFYDIYRRRYAERRPTDSQVLGRELVLHTEFAQRVADIWQVPPVRGTSKGFSEATYEITQKLEQGLRKVLNELWP